MNPTEMNLPTKTPSGKAWLEKYLHPPGAASAPVTGIPDHSSSSSVNVEWRNDTPIDAPAITATDVWSALIVCLPNPHWPAVVFRWLNGVVPTSAVTANPLWINNANFSFGGNDINWANNSSKFRPAYRSYTSRLDAAALINQGRVFAAQCGLEKQEVNQITPVAGAPLREDIYMDRWPTEASLILQLSDKAYSGAARDGCYMAMGLNDPAIQYITAVPKETFIDGNFGATGIKIPMGGSTVTNNLTAPTHGSMNLGYILYNNLDPKAVIDLKIIQGWEVIPTPSSAWAPFVTPGAPPDTLALEGAFEARYHMQDAYPAAANDLGSIWRGLKSFAPALGAAYKAAKPIFRTGISALPGGGLINQVVDALEEVVLEDSSKLSGLQGKARKNQKKKLEKDEMKLERVLNERKPLPAGKQNLSFMDSSGLSKNKRKKMRRILESTSF